MRQVFCAKSESLENNDEVNRDHRLRGNQQEFSNDADVARSFWQKNKFLTEKGD